MDAWETMFLALRNIIRSAGNFEEGLRLTFAAAQANPLVFDGPDYWAEAERSWSQKSADIVVNWSKEGLESLSHANGWQFLLLDLGDGPDTFRLYSPSGQDQISEQTLRDLILPRTYIEASELEDCVVTEVSNTYDLLFGEARQECADHNVGELHDAVLTWNDNQDMEWHGDNGYFLWLMVGTLALLEPLRDKDYCRQVLVGRDSLYLLSGFESVFTYLATVTQEGLIIEGDTPPSMPS